MARQSTRRRGVLLLVVLSLLTLFAVISITFVIIAAHHRTTAKAGAKSEQYRDDYKKQLDEAFLQIVRDTTNPNSVALGHSLLRDMYGGEDSVLGQLSGAAVVRAGGQFTELPVPFNVAQYPYSAPNYFAGCVLTMLDGPAAGLSTRVVRYEPAAAAPVLHVMAFEGNRLPAVGNRFLINGRPFNGTGFGYNRETGKLDATDSADPTLAKPFALLPNPRFFENNNIGPRQAGYPYFGGLGGADEDYDIADPQNMMLARIGSNPSEPFRIIPSLHRPDLVQYMQTQYSAEWSDPAAGPALMRKVILRPLQQDNPLFTGSNPSFNPINGPWDVDNDGDGIPDSVWVDLGMPVQTAPDGRRYKPLFAILCLDLDNRLNVNAHGSSSQTAPAYLQGPVGDFAGATAGQPVPIPRGQGYGPADISLAPLKGFAATPTDYEQFLVGYNGWEGRYGELGASALPLAHDSTGNVVDQLTIIKNFEVPNNFSADLRSYGTPPDFWGRSAIGLDWRGQPLYLDCGIGELANNPYALNLSRKRIRASKTSGAIDNPFTMAELEPILRMYDLDIGSMPARLKALFPALATTPMLMDDLRWQATTDSWDLPTPSIHAPRELEQVMATQEGGVHRSHLHLVDLLRAKLINRGMTNEATISQTITRLLPAEVIAGQRLDLSRPLGNALDDNSNGVVDEPQEYSVNNEAGWAGAFPPSGTAIPFDLNNDGQLNAGDTLARQELAKHLYVMMLLVYDESYETANWALEANLNPTQRRELFRRRVAQWAINVVEYRDSDAIMTPFEYDVDPFNGWDVDGALGSADDTSSERRLVWGCEYPELLLTETLAFHDRRVKDSANDNNPNPGDREKLDDGNPATDDDEDLDQARIPQGSLFFELYCTRNGNASPHLYPAELYTFDANSSRWYLDLSRLSPAASDGQRYPVWQVAITDANHKSGRKNDVLARLNGRPDSTTLDPPLGISAFNANERLDLERFVWFTPLKPAGTATLVNPRRVYYNRRSPTLLAPGGYAVVGPRDVTRIGKTTGGQPSQQLIRVFANGIAKTEPDGTSNYPALGQDIQRPIGIICAADPPAAPLANPWNANGAAGRNGIGISVSEPTIDNNYYPEPTEVDPATNAIEAYGTDTDPTKLYLDQPLDSRQGMPLRERPTGQQTGTTLSYRTLLLQRLANPLLPYDPVLNPYITVDFNPVDLTVFNGEQHVSAYSKPDPEDPNWDPSTNPQVPFASRQRGLRGAAAGVGDMNIWNPLSNPPDALEAARSSDVFDYSFKHRLGYLNEAYGMPWSVNQPTPADPNWVAPPNRLYIGDPDPRSTGNRTFPWITWPNRPLISAHELLLVPASSATKLPFEVTFDNGAPNPYDTNGANFHSPFRHLLNFCMSSSPQAAAADAPNFSRILEFVHVPSRFVGTETMLSPDVFAGTLSDSATAGFRAPFNKVSNYREPGRININTVEDQAVWLGFSNGRNPAYADVRNSRRGGAGAGSHPSIFGNPFRSFAGARLQLPGAPPLTREIEATLLRSDASATTGTTDGTKPLFEHESAGAWDDANRNAYFRYLNVVRMSNLVTTRSNVYAVWITVGYFEVLPWNNGQPDKVHPDGFQLGSELGIDTGEVRRHRAFYVIDRTLPVGFQPGEDHNVERAILLKRFIE